jgi:hypothetical protein
MKIGNKRMRNLRRIDGTKLTEKQSEKTNSAAYKAEDKSSKFLAANDNRNKSKFCDTNNTNNTNNAIDDNNIVPLEIDTHFQMYGKHAWEVEYGEKCPVCNKRIDEYGLCACGTGGE